MNATQATFTMVLLFALRCLLPLALMFGIGYAMNWLVDRWEAEAAGEGHAAADTHQVTAVPPSQVRRCWAFNLCNSERRQYSPYLTQKKFPCWLLRTRREGELPAECLDCPIYKQKPSFA